MNKLFGIFLAVLFAFAPVIAFAQPVPLPPTGAYHVIERCYTVLFPYPHSRCEYVRVRHNYTPLPSPPHRIGPRHGHRPPPPNGHRHRGHDPRH